jgi:putative acetyltransferase
MIREMKMLDLERVMGIWLAGNKQAHSFIAESYWHDNLPLVREQLPSAEVWVYESEGTVQGFIGIMEKSFIAGLFVAVSRQSGGVGRALVNHSKEHYGPLSLHVYADNDRAVQFYLKCGFTVAGEMINGDTRYREYVMKTGG